MQVLYHAIIGPTLEQQAEQFYEALAELARQYQFRDREGACCHGLSVSQCHSLEAIYVQGTMAIGELANYLHLDISSMTRVVDHLVAEKLAERIMHAKDRRICRVEITRKGRTLVQTIRAELIEPHEIVLAGIRPESRGAAISAVSRLLEAFKERKASAGAGTLACPSRRRRVSWHEGFKGRVAPARRRSRHADVQTLKERG